MNIVEIIFLPIMAGIIISLIIIGIKTMMIKEEKK